MKNYFHPSILIAIFLLTLSAQEQPNIKFTASYDQLSVFSNQLIKPYLIDPFI